MSVRLLHYYRCSFDQTTAKSTTRTNQPPIKCALCLRLMAYQWSSEIDEAEWHERNLRPVEFVSAHAVAVIPPELREKKCGRRECYVYKPKPELLNGRFCSEACGALDSEEMAAGMERIDQLYRDMPWLVRPSKAKEIA